MDDHCRHGEAVIEGIRVHEGEALALHAPRGEGGHELRLALEHGPPCIH
jgi:hypothetical protein